MREGFTKLIIGFIFLFLDVSLMGFDVFLDPIGYLIIYIGMNEVTDVMDSFKEFEKGRLFAIVLVFISIPSVIFGEGININTNIELINYWGYGNVFVLGIITTILLLVLSYYLFIGISRKAKLHEFYRLERLSYFTWILILVVNIGLYTTMLIPFLTIPSIIIEFIVMILQFRVLVKAKETFSQIESTEIIE